MSTLLQPFRDMWAWWRWIVPAMWQDRQYRRIVLPLAGMYIAIILLALYWPR